jgi:hypothetical protein
MPRMVTPRMFEKMFGRDSYGDEIYHDRFAPTAKQWIPTARPIASINSSFKEILPTPLHANSTIHPERRQSADELQVESLLQTGGDVLEDMELNDEDAEEVEMLK